MQSRTEVLSTFLHCHSQLILRLTPHVLNMAAIAHCVLRLEEGKKHVPSLYSILKVMKTLPEVP